MTLSSDMEQALALSRFGLGSGMGGVTAVGDARDVLHQEIATPVPMPQGDGLKASPDLMADLLAYQQERKLARDAMSATPPSAPGPAMNGDPMAMAPASPPAPQAPAVSDGLKMDKDGKLTPDINPVRDTQSAEVDARFNGTVKSPLIGFNERLVMFWMNHFAVSLKKDETVGIMAGAFEREAIRPHVFGRFYDLLLAVETHPCMLDYLDNQQSVGPNSRASGHGKRGLNENLAREIMELHTLGVGSGYTQADVTSFAKVITGWTFAHGNNLKPGEVAGVFAFAPQAHEPGPQTILGKTYADTGFDQGKAVLLDLTRHPATATHIAPKLARHFVADGPPPALVARLADTFRRTDGDLAAVSRALIEAKEAWSPQLVKVRSPLHYMCALIRSTGSTLKPGAITATLANMGQPLWQPSGPNGYPDIAAAWASPEGLSARLDVVNAMAVKMDRSIDPRAFADQHLGAMLSDATRQAIARAETRPQGLGLFFLSPEFMRC